MRYIMTQHAVEQFMRRWQPNETFDAAKSELHALLRTSGYNGKTKMGDQIVISGLRPEIRMIIKDGNVCVTVLPDMADEQSYIDEMEELEYARQEQITQIKSDIQYLEQELSKVNQTRLALGKKKTNLLSNLQVLKNKVEKMKWVPNNVVDIEE